MYSPGSPITPACRYFVKSIKLRSTDNMISRGGVGWDGDGQLFSGWIGFSHIMLDRLL